MRAATRRLAALAAALALLGCSVILIEPLRSVAARSLFAAYLTTKGLHVSSADLHIGSRRLDLRDLAIDDAQKRLVLSARSLSLAYAFSGAHLVVQGLDIDRLHLIVRRAADGSFDLARAFGSTAANGATSAPGPPSRSPSLVVRGIVTVRDGTIDFENQFSPARPGRAFALRRLNALIRMDTDGLSEGTFSAELAARRQTFINGTYRQDAPLGVGDMRASAAGVDIAPLLDYFISSPAFVAEDGTADLSVHAYVLGPSAAWSVAANGTFMNTRLRITPLVVPVRSLRGPFALVDGLLILRDFSGTAATVPISGRGAVTLLPSPWLDLSVTATGQLSEVRKLLAVTKPLRLQGDVALALRILASPTDPQIGIGFAMRHGWKFAETTLGRTNGQLVYNHGQVTVPSVRTEIAGVRAYGSGDIDVSSTGVPTGQLLAFAGGPSAAIPWITDLDPAGAVTARIAFSGSLAQPEIGGFMELNGRRTLARGTFSSNPTTLSVGPLVAKDKRGGMLVARAQVLQGADRSTSGSVIADHFFFDLDNRRVGLPGILERQVGTQALSGMVDGIAVTAGQRNAWLFQMRMRLRGLIANGTSYGDADLDGSGAVRQRPSGQILASLNLHHRGGAAPVSSVADAHAVLALTGSHVLLYSANARLAGGAVGLSGDVRLGTPVPTDLLLWANHVDLAQVGIAALPPMTGELTALGHSSLSAGRLRFEVGATARDVSLAGKTVSADADLAYDGQSLAMRDSRIVIGRGSAIDLTGSIDVPHSLSSLSQARVNLDAQMHHGDIADVATLSPARLPLGGGVDATARITGVLGSPSVRGNVASDFGTLRGVAFQHVHATIAASRGMLDIDNAQATIGSSSFRLSGQVARAATSVALVSSNLNLADFNDFFGGRDVLAGAGTANMAVRFGQTYAGGSGSLRLSGVAVEDVPLGTVQARLALPNRDRVAFDLDSSGAVGSSRIVATIGYRPTMSFVAGAATKFAMTANLRDIDVSELRPLLPPSAEGLRGRVNLQMSAWGAPGSLRGNARFNLADGFFGKDRISDLSGSMVADDRGIELQSFHGLMAGVDLSAHGTYTEDRHFTAHARLSTTDIAQLERISMVSQYVQGPVVLDLDASGTPRAPSVHAMLSAGKGTVLRVPYESATADMTYHRGALTVKDATLALAAHRGTIALQGTLPTSVGRQATQVRSSPSLRLQFAANRLDLAALDPLMLGSGSLEGQFNARALATGSLARPQFNGTAQLRDGVVRSQVETVPLTKIDADAVFSQDEVILQRLHGVVGKGTIDATGNARFGPAAGAGLARAAYDVQLKARGADLSVPQYFSGVVDADFGINTQRVKPQVNSDIIISNTNIPLAGILALASSSSLGAQAQTGPVPGVPPYRPGHTIVYGGQIYGTGDEPHVVQPTPPPIKHKHIAAPLALNVDASAGDNVQVTGLINATGSGTVHVGGSAGSPVMSGDLSVIRGSASLFDTTFRLVRGDVAFHPSDGALPTVDAEAIAFRPEADITARVWGRVDQLHTELDSDPPMSQQDILSSILHIGDINAALSGTSGASSGTNGASGAANTPSAGVSLARIAGGAAAAPLLNAVNFGLEKTLHVEEANLAFDQNGQPSVELRKQYGKNLFAVFRSSFGAPPDQEVGVVYSHNGLELQWFQKQNTAGQTFTQQGQYQTWQLLYRFPNKEGPGRKPRPSTQQKLNSANLGP